MTSIDDLSRELDDIANRLDRCAVDVRDLKVEPTTENIQRLGRALSSIFEIQRSIYSVRPDLKPTWLKEAEDDHY